MTIKKKNSSARWLTRQENDYYVKEAKKQGYRSRAAFKLIEIQKKFQILKKGDKVLELGAAPGSWSQIVLKLVLDQQANHPQVFAVDLTPVEKLEKVFFILKDCNMLSIEDYELIGLVDAVLSDMSYPTTGHSALDHPRSVKLCITAFNIAQKALKVGGHLVIKIFQGQEIEKIVLGLSQAFTKVYRFKPNSSRKESKEIYLVAVGKLQA